MLKNILIFIFIFNFSNVLNAEENNMLKIFGNRILNNNKEKRISISEVDKNNKNIKTIFGNIIDIYGETNINPNIKKDWEEDDTLITKDGILILEYSWKSKLILMENTEVEVFHDYIKIIKGKIYFNIVKIDKNEKPLKISTNFAEYVEPIEGEGIIKINDEVSQIKLLNGFIKVYKTLKFFDNYNITSNYIYQYEFTDPNNNLMSLVEKNLFYDKTEFVNIKRYLEVEDTEIENNNENEINTYLKEQEYN